jgi:hypothetical protein
MDPDSTAEFKIKLTSTNTTLKKIAEEKSETTKDDTFRNSLSRLKSNEVPSS